MATWLMALFAVLTMPAVQAQQGYGLKDCIDYANGNNNSIRVAKLNERYVDYQRKEITGRALPQITGTTALDDNLKLQTSLLPAVIFGGAPDTYVPVKFGTQYNLNARAQANLMIYDQSYWLGLKAAKTNQSLATQKTEQVTQDAAYKIAQAYYNAVIVSQQVTLLQNNLAKTEKLLQQADVQFKNGALRKLEADKIRVNRNNIKYQLVQANLKVQQSVNSLKNAMGMPVEESIFLRDTALNGGNAQEIPMVTNTGYANRIEYKLQQTNLDVQTLLRKNNLTGYYPTLNAYYNYGVQAQRNEFNYFESGHPWFQYSAMGLSLSVPIFDGLQRNYRDQQNKVNMSIAQENLELTKKNLSTEQLNATLSYNNQLQSLQSAKENQDLSESVLNNARFEFSQGISTAQAVLDAENSFQQARNNYTNALLSLYLARLDVERAKGTIINYINEQK